MIILTPEKLAVLTKSEFLQIVFTFETVVSLTEEFSMTYSDRSYARMYKLITDIIKYTNVYDIKVVTPVLRSLDSRLIGRIEGMIEEFQYQLVIHDITEE